MSLLISKASLYHAVVRALSVVFLSVVLVGCAALPSNGPTAGQIQHSARSPQNTIGFAIVDITPGTIAGPQAASSSIPDSLGALAAVTPFQSADIIRPGDKLSVGIYEVGVSLFGGAASIGAQAALQGEPPVANGAQLAIIQVDEKGDIRLPYVGVINVAGNPPQVVQKMIEARLHGMSQSPQAMVAIVESVTNSAYLTGAVAKPGRYTLTPAHEKLLDVLAIAGGPTVDLEDAEIRVVRNGHSGSIRLGDVRAEDMANIVLSPGDRIEVRKDVRTYTVFGATDKVSQVPFGVRTLALSEAIARVGGPSDMRANPKGIFLFRFERSKDGTGEKPIVYRLDMMNPASYFLAQRFAMQDKDLIYFSNSSSNPPAKFIALVNQLFSPVVTARYLAQ